MSMTDPIADMLTRIRNANAIRREITASAAASPMNQNRRVSARREPVDVAVTTP